jgi:peptidoglycan/LPS O-acetylase OafA/YrhL
MARVSGSEKGLGMIMERPAATSTRYQALDAWRGIVCLIVVLEHAGVALWNLDGGITGFDGWLRQGIVRLLCLNLGAPLFFVISGYCIASSLDSSRRKGTPSSRFLARRLWRIFPPYWASVAVIALLVMALDRLGLEGLHRTAVGLELASPFQLNQSQWFGNLTLTETWRPLVGGSFSILLNRVAWALCYQEQFYLVCFLALVLAPKRLYGALGAATVAIVSLRVFLWDSGRLHDYFGLFPDLWHEFAVGLALYWRINVARSWISKRAVELGLVALFGIGYSTELVSTAAAAGFGLLLIICYRWDGQIARIRQLDGLRACGRRSYSIYLIHLPVCTVGNAVIAAMGVSGFWPRATIMIPIVTAASVAAGWAFYSLVDRRFTSLPTLRKPMPAKGPASDVSAMVSAVEETPIGVPSWSS